MSGCKEPADAVDDPPTPDAHDEQRPAISELLAANVHSQDAVTSLDREAAVKGLYFIMQSVEVTQCVYFFRPAPIPPPDPFTYVFPSHRLDAVLATARVHNLCIPLQRSPHLVKSVGDRDQHAERDKPH